MDFSLEHKEQENSMARIAIEDAQKLVFQEGIPVETEYCPVSECAGRVLAEDLTSAFCPFGNGRICAQGSGY